LIPSRRSGRVLALAADEGSTDCGPRSTRIPPVGARKMGDAWIVCSETCALI
jgi:hypothetical protein